MMKIDKFERTYVLKKYVHNVPPMFSNVHDVPYGIMHIPKY